MHFTGPGYKTQKFLRYRLSKIELCVCLPKKSLKRMKKKSFVCCARADCMCFYMFMQTDDGKKIPFFTSRNENL